MEKETIKVAENAQQKHILEKKKSELFNEFENRLENWKNIDSATYEISELNIAKSTLENLIEELAQVINEYESV